MTERPRNGILITTDYGKVDVVILQVWTEGGIANVHMTSEEARRLARRLIGTADVVEPASGADPIGSVFVVGDMRRPAQSGLSANQQADIMGGLAKALDEA